ncbi:hypothetical protein ACI513_09160 [Chryseobacterium sp. M5]|uniref:hypothetical protein n=1 Tax=Chryseobacterium sp. M5 TaxID=3379128 RepID=UPI003857DE17
MIRLTLKLFLFLFFIIFSKISGQLYQVFQVVNIEKYQGKNFILEGKIFYNNEINNNSWMVLSALFLNEKGTGMKEMIHSDNAQIYYKKGEWSPYELKGKIIKNAKGIAVGVSVAGKGSYYLDDFKLFVLEGKNKIEVPLKNHSFEDASLMPWQSYAKDEGSKMSISTAKPLSGIFVY